MIKIQMAKPGIYVLQGLAMQSLRDLSGCPDLTEEERYAEAARIAFPKYY